MAELPIESRGEAPGVDRSVEVSDGAGGLGRLGHGFVLRDLNFSNRPVRTRMPWWCGRGGRANARPPYPD